MVAFVFVYRFSVYDEGGVKLKNPNIELMDQDILYHLALGNESHDLVEMFGDVKVRTHTYLGYLCVFLAMYPNDKVQLILIECFIL